MILNNQSVFLSWITKIVLPKVYLPNSTKNVHSRRGKIYLNERVNTSKLIGNIMQHHIVSSDNIIS